MCHRQYRLCNTYLYNARRYLLHSYLDLMKENNENKGNYKNKWMQLPRNVVVGHGVINDTGKVCKDLKLNGSTLIVTGATTLNKAGKTVAVSLEDSGFNVNTAIVETPSLEEIKKVESLASAA